MYIFTTYVKDTYKEVNAALKCKRSHESSTSKDFVSSMSKDFVCSTPKNLGSSMSSFNIQPIRDTPMSNYSTIPSPNFSNFTNQQSTRDLPKSTNSTIPSPNYSNFTNQQSTRDLPKSSNSTIPSPSSKLTNKQSTDVPKSTNSTNSTILSPSYSKLTNKQSTRDLLKSTNVTIPSPSYSKLTDKQSIIKIPKPTSSKYSFFTKPNKNEMNVKRPKSPEISKMYGKLENLKRKSDVLVLSHSSETHENSKSNKRSPLKNKILNVDNISLTIPTLTEIPFKDLIFLKDDKLGRGSFGTVTKGSWSNTAVAIKTIEMVCSSPREIIKEVSILKQISHENIVQIMGVCHYEMQFHIVTELIDGRNLNDVIHKSSVRSKFNLNESKKKLIGQQICKAISFMHLHPQQIIHRDIKPANILLSYDMKVKICDLGLAKIKNISSQLMTTQGRRSCAGTTFYMAPEILLYKNEATKFSDVWSLGCTLLEFYNNHLVWDLQSSNPYEELCRLLKKETMPNVGSVPI